MVEDAGKRSKKRERRRRKSNKKWWSENGSENADLQREERMDEARCRAASSETTASFHEKKGFPPSPLLPGIYLDCSAERGGTQDGIALMEDDSFVPAFFFRGRCSPFSLFCGKI